MSLQEILALRESMWEKVSSRLHTVLEVFPFGKDSNNIMLHGTVNYGFESSNSMTLEWAARAHLVHEQEQAKLDFYQVYIVRSSLMTLRFVG